MFDQQPAQHLGDTVASYRFSTPATLAARLRELAQRRGITAFMLLLAGWSLALRQWSGVAHFRVGTDIANRNHQASAGIVGFFVNQLAIPVSVAGELTTAAFLEQLRGDVLDAFEHQDAPFDQVVNAVRPGGRDGRAPLYAVKFIHRDVSQSVPLLAGCTLQEFPLERSAAEIDLLLKSTASSERIDFELEYASGLFQERSMAKVSRMLLWMLEALASEGDQPIDRLLLQTEAQEEGWRVADARQRSGRLPGLRRNATRSGEDTKVAP